MPAAIFFLMWCPSETTACDQRKKRRRVTTILYTLVVAASHCGRTHVAAMRSGIDFAHRFHVRYVAPSRRQLAPFPWGCLRCRILRREFIKDRGSLVLKTNTAFRESLPLDLE